LSKQNTYTSFAPIGENPFSSTYRAYKTATQQAVVVRLFHRDVLRSPKDERRFTEDVRSLAAVEHPVLVPPLETGVTSAREPYITRLRVSETSLAAICAESPIELSQALHIAERLASAAAALAEAGWTHGAISPTNVFLGDGGAVMLTDALSPLAVASNPAGLRGRPAHLAPEMLATSVATPASDSYSIISTINAVLDHHALPPLVDELFDACLSPDPTDRVPPYLLVRFLNDAKRHVASRGPDATRIPHSKSSFGVIDITTSGHDGTTEPSAFAAPAIRISSAAFTTPSRAEVPTPRMRASDFDDDRFHADTDAMIEPGSLQRLTPAPAPAGTTATLAAPRTDQRFDPLRRGNGPFESDDGFPPVAATLHIPAVRPEEPRRAWPEDPGPRSASGGWKAPLAVALVVSVLAAFAWMMSRTDDSSTSQLSPTNTPRSAPTAPTPSVFKASDSPFTLKVPVYAAVDGPRDQVQIKVQIEAKNVGTTAATLPDGANAHVRLIFTGTGIYRPAADANLKPTILDIDPTSISKDPGATGSSVTAVPPNSVGATETFTPANAQEPVLTFASTLEPTDVDPDTDLQAAPGTSPALVFYVPKNARVLGLAVLSDNNDILSWSDATDWGPRKSGNDF
jgi:serine/threonine protein kinase